MIVGWCPAPFLLLTWSCWSCRRARSWLAQAPPKYGTLLVPAVKALQQRQQRAGQLATFPSCHAAHAVQTVTRMLILLLLLTMILLNECSWFCPWYYSCCSDRHQADHAGTKAAARAGHAGFFADSAQSRILLYFPLSVSGSVRLLVHSCTILYTVWSIQISQFE